MVYNQFAIRSLPCCNTNDFGYTNKYMQEMTKGRVSGPFAVYIMAIIGIYSYQ
uniref:Uncharacterized protein n=1 Tax=Yersinia enterocolitica W22703 TaxID=913028 RepID=F4N7F2_YEREN|nr:unknown protein [Yersinia enterocolitica W22703]